MSRSGGTAAGHPVVTRLAHARTPPLPLTPSPATSACQVNEYPGQRTFKAIGSGGDDFVVSMERSVASVVGTVHAECVSHRFSAQGKYVSVTVGPVWVESPEQVLAIYENMKADGRLRFFF